MRGKFSILSFSCNILTITKVPEDLLSILNDTSLFNNSGDITTKEILKRYGDIAANGGPRHQVETTQGKPPRSKDGSGRAQHAPVVRVDTDPTQQNAMQTETSVRHVQENPQGNVTDNSPSTQTHWRGDELDHISPYAQTGYPSRDNLPFAKRAGNGGDTPDSLKENGAGQRNWRNSGWGGGQRPPNGSAGPGKDGRMN